MCVSFYSIYPESFVWPWDLSLQRHKQADHKWNSVKLTKALNRWSTSPWLKPSFRKDLNTNRHLFALINLARTCSLYLQFSWNATPKMGSSVHCGMLLTCAISWIKPFLRKIISLHFDRLQIILFSLDQIKNWSTKSVWQWPLLQTGTMRVESSV